MLECRGSVRHLGKPPQGSKWEIKFNKAGIPYLADSAGTLKKWAMTYFQDSTPESRKDTESRPMDLSLDRVDDDMDDIATKPVVEGQKPAAGTPTMDVKSVQSVTGQSWVLSDSVDYFAGVSCREFFLWTPCVRPFSFLHLTF